MRIVVRLGAFAFALIFAASCALAESFPSRPVRLLVPYAAGGSVDTLARTLGQPLSEIWGQQLVVENRPGAAGIIASQALVQAAPDGYTLIVVASGHAVNHLIYKTVPYDTFRDFTPISELAGAANVLLANKEFRAKSLADVLQIARKEPGSLSYGMAGVGTSVHLAGEMLKHLAKVDMVSVAYKGDAPSVTALMSGEIPLSFNTIPGVLSQIENGSVRALAVTSAQRSPVLPTVPTMSEAGVPGYDTTNWWGVLGPAGMRPEIVDKLHSDFRKALDTPSTRDRLKGLGAVAVGSTPQEFSARIRSDAQKWEPIVKAAKIQAD